MSRKFAETAAFVVEANKVMREACLTDDPEDRVLIEILDEQMTVIRQAIKSRNTRGLSTIRGDYIEMLSDMFSNDANKLVNAHLEQVAGKSLDDFDSAIVSKAMEIIARGAIRSKGEFVDLEVYWNLRRGQPSSDKALDDAEELLGRFAKQYG
jgi:hypothetical protein